MNCYSQTVYPVHLPFDLGSHLSFYINHPSVKKSLGDFNTAIIFFVKYSLQQIGDYYISQGLKGKDLRNALENDTKYQTLLKGRKAVIRNKYDISKQEEKEYLLPNEEDYEILSIVKSLESKNLSDHDKEMVELIKTQLKDDWREPLIKSLKQITKKYF